MNLVGNLTAPKGPVNIDVYCNRFNEVDLESQGIYLVDHDAFAVPSIESGDMSFDLDGGGKRLYSQLRERKIKINLKMDNERFGPSRQDYALYECTRLFYTSGPKRLILQERPDRYINCMLSGPITISDSPGFTTVNFSLVAYDPLFYSIDIKKIPAFTQGTVRQVICNGNGPHFPILDVSGPATNLEVKIENDWGIFLANYSRSLASSDHLLIDTKTRQATLNDRDVGKDFSSDLVMAPGLNNISFTANSTAANLSLEYQQTYL